tara:strand:+ start:390 stop:1304 length:915 start_codon:yes stop_codon:yes gene_type:complete
MSISTSSTTIEQMYADIVQDLVPFYMDKVLLPNPQIILNSINVEGSSGDQVRFPLENALTDAADVAEGASIIAAANSNLTPTAANITFQKRGVGSDVTQEAVDDGLFDMVVGSTLNRLSSGLAQATDVAGLALCKTSFTNNDGATGANANFTQSFVMSPEALAYAAKREPVVKVWYNPNKDIHEFRGTVRNGFAALRATFGRTIKSANLGGNQFGVAASKANVEAIATSVANLRAANAPVGADGMYVGIIDPGLELSINEQIAGLGGTTIGSLSDLGNNALRNAMVAMIAGATLYRSNNLPDAS